MELASEKEQSDKREEVGKCESLGGLGKVKNYDFNDFNI